LLDKLNAQQREAVLATEGPVLVLAGAGTGKTRVITYRIAHLLERRVPGSAILAVTFTNKAANVMRERINECCEPAGRRLPTCGYPRSIRSARGCCAAKRRILGCRAISPSTMTTTRPRPSSGRCCSSILPTDDFPPRAIRSQISHAKNHGITPEEMRADADQARDEMRQQAVRGLPLTMRSFAKRPLSISTTCCCDRWSFCANMPDVRAAWSSRFQYVMVDEFQDTNASQEELVRLLAGARKNVCVVGDEDQSIYGWRGARAGNLKRFTEDFPGAKIIRLEENYRSTQTILDAAAAVVATIPTA
jgi:DNA helicase II / ATP-dependent DNA helicase PcrA